MGREDHILKNETGAAGTGGPPPPAIVVVAEHFQGELCPVTGEALAFGLELERNIHGRLEAVIAGDEIDDMAADMARLAGAPVTAINVTGLAAYNGETYRAVFGDFLRRSKPAYVCIPHTSRGWDFGPSLAVQLDASYIADVRGIVMEDGAPLFTHGVCGGKFVAHTKPEAKTAVITVRPGKFKAPAAAAVTDLRVNHMKIDPPPVTARFMGITQPRTADAGLTEARVVVAAGKGIGKEENMSLIRGLAEIFPKSAVAGSRVVCDLGWLSVRSQVGLTGATVAPSLYIACGISGASQHVAGMHGSEFVVAVNTDPHASIFNESDICVVEDATTFIPELLAQLAR